MMEMMKYGTMFMHLQVLKSRQDRILAFNSSEFPWKIQFEKICKCNDNCYWIKLRNNYQPAKCLNTGRPHSSSGIYFIITPNRLYQKCHCIKDTMNGRKYGFCHSFRSRVIPNGHGVWKLPLVIKNHLFPEKKERKNSIEIFRFKTKDGKKY